MRGARRWPRLILGAGLLVALAGCSGNAGADTGTRPPPTPTRLPAEYAGGACNLLTYTMVEGALGLHFDVAAADQDGDSYSCVLQGESGTYPDLRLMVTPSKADAATFVKAVRPKGATSVSGLGKAGYRSRGSGENGGAAVEIGWLSGDARLLTLRVTLPKGAPAGQAAELATRLVTLARKIDHANV